MSKIDELIDEIKTQQIGQTGKKVLVVEGVDDVLVFQSFLTKQKANWEGLWIVAPAQGKSRVLDVLRKEPNWLGVIDRDEWSDADVEQAANSLPNLFVLPRFCIESYLIVPDEIWAALPPPQREKLPNGQADLQNAIVDGLALWIRHAALWKVVNPLYQRMRDPGHRGSILDEPLQVPNPDELKQVLQTWLAGMEPEVVVNQVDALERQYTEMPPAQLFTQHLYAKKFYPMVVHGALNRLLGQKPEKERVQALLRTLPLPADLAPVWQLMGL